MGTLCLGSAGINLQYWWSILGSSLQNSILAKDNSGFSSASYDHFWRHRSGPHYRGLVLVCYCVWRLPWLQFRSRWSVGSSISAGRRSWWACGYISLSPGQWFVPALPSRGRPGHKWRFPINPLWHTIWPVDQDTALSTLFLAAHHRVVPTVWQCLLHITLPNTAATSPSTFRIDWLNEASKLNNQELQNKKKRLWK